MYFNIYLKESNTYVRTFDYIDFDENIEFYDFKIQLTKIESRFEQEYDTSKYYMCILSSDPGIKGGK